MEIPVSELRIEKLLPITGISAWYNCAGPGISKVDAGHQFDTGLASLMNTSRGHQDMRLMHSPEERARAIISALTIETCP